MQREFCKRYFHQDKPVSIRELVRKYNQFFLPTIWRHTTKEVKVRRMNKCSRGVPKPKLNSEEEVAIIRTLR